MINVEHLTKQYGQTRAVDDVSFTVQEGEILGFLGPNGAGKSTTMKIITCFIPSTSGTVTVGGFDIFNDPMQVKKRIGYMPESVPSYTDMTAKQYLTFMAKIKGVSGKERDQKVRDVIGKCGIEEMQHKLVGRLSKGYRQRVGLAQALVHDPDILILDEPTSGLDPHQIIEIRSLIKEMGQKKTLILSSHILPEVSMTCARVVIINRGKIVASDTPDQLMKALKGTEKIYLQVDGPRDEIPVKLKQIPQIEAIKTEDRADPPVFIVESKLHTDIRKEIAQCVLQNGWGLLEMRPVGMSLEDVFIELTTEEYIAE